MSRDTYIIFWLAFTSVSLIGFALLSLLGSRALSAVGIKLGFFYTTITLTGIAGTMLGILSHILFLIAATKWGF